ncbi:MAG: hypothetical protein QM775_07850 [Pirellulales bacterium]
MHDGRPNGPVFHDVPFKRAELGEFGGDLPLLVGFNCREFVAPHLGVARSPAQTQQREIPADHQVSQYPNGEIGRPKLGGRLHLPTEPDDRYDAGGEQRPQGRSCQKPPGQEYQQQRPSDGAFRFQVAESQRAEADQQRRADDGQQMSGRTRGEGPFGIFKLARQNQCAGHEASQG